jgi:predicted nucleic acid-binding protein
MPIRQEAAGLISVSRLLTVTEVAPVIKEDTDDDQILECAMTAGSDYIVTGDKFSCVWLE